MIDFKTRLKENSKDERIRTYRRKLLLANNCLEAISDSDTPNNCLYLCATHLSQVPELEVNEAEFSSLANYPLNQKFDTEVYVVLRDRCKDLDNLIKTLIFNTEV